MKCRRCNGLIHLPCYGIIKSSDEIFACNNILLLCDECLEIFNVSCNENSPKRKQSTNLIQRTIDTNNSTIALSMSSPIISYKGSNKYQNNVPLHHAI